MDIKDIYKQLTNVNIEEQKKLWNERGKGYYGEYLVFCELYKKIVGNCKILMNLNIPTEKGKTTEIDLLMIHETGIYVFEIKHYKGKIYGNDTGEIWTQYFRTVKNSVFKNPMLQNEYHIEAINKLFKDIPIKSVIVFTSSDCEIKVKNANENIDLCTLHDLNRTIERRFNLNEIKYSMEEIDTMFETLSKYSPMQEVVPYDGKEEPFIYWLEPIIKELEKEKNNSINNFNDLKKIQKITKLMSIVIAIVCIIFTIFSVNAIKNNYNNELNKFKQNFKHVDEIGNEYINALNDYVNVTNISFNEISDNVVSFSARISMSNDIYGVALTENSKYIVMTNSGRVFEYDVFGEHLRYYRYANKIGKGIREYGDLARIQFYGVNENDITYIKITNIELFKLDIGQTIIKDNLEIELYKK